MGSNERILELIKEKGPVIPAQISKDINDSLLITSARLSELLSGKHLKISCLKFGGSPLYYLPGQESMLQNFSGNLNGVEKKAYSLLEQNKILKDSGQDPQTRVALRNIKDFAVPLQVNYENKIEIFWKWYLMDNNEAEPLIKDLLSKQAPLEKIQQKAEEIKEPQKEAIKEEIAKEKPKEEPKAEVQKELKNVEKKPKKPIDKTGFLREINNFFNKSNVKIVESIDAKKGPDLDFIVELQTSLGNIKYFCKSRDKKKISDADIGSALLQAQSKNLPLLFVTNGSLTKNAQEMLDKDFKNIIFKSI